MKKQLRRITSAVLAVMLVLTSLLTLNVADVKAASGVLEASGHLESAYVEWAHISGATGYNVYVKSGSSSYTKLDNELVRQYPGYMRADAVGLAAGNYTMKIVPIISGSENSSKALETGSLTVIGHDRAGFAFKNGKAFGAYNADGTLKSNAKVFYMTESTKGGFAAAVEAAADGNYPLAVRIIGKVTDFSGQDKGDMLIEGCENGLTVEGIGEDATAYGWGIRIKGSSNVEVRNIGLMWNDSTEGDGIGLQQDNTCIWIHNNDFFYGAPGSDADQVKGDGALDTKKSTYVTHSYNHFWDSGKCHLNGNGDTVLNYITYHHNWYDHSDSRHPLIRVSSAVHIYNNLYDGVAKYGVIVRKGASAFVEANYFKDTNKPLLISKQGTDAADPISSDPGGIIKAYANKYDNTKAPITHKDSSTDFDCYEASSKTEKVPSSYKCLSGGTSYSNFDTASSMYSYTAQSADAAKATVMQYAGRINGGDFDWDFSAASEDRNYDVISGLQSAIKSYKTTLLSIGGNKIVSDSTPAPEPTQSQEVTTQAPQETTKAPEATTQATQSTTQATTQQQVSSNAIYVSPSGSSSASGTYSSPMSFATAITKVSAGQTIYMLPGTYKLSSTILIEESNKGNSGAYKKVVAYNNGEVILDFSSMSESGSNRGIVLDGSYWHFYGIDIKGAGDNGMLLSGDNNIIEMCQFYENHDTGLQLSRYNTSYSSVSQWPSNNLIKNCTSFNNKDDATAENADGFAAKLTCGEGNVFDGCIAYCNSDDGWDLYAKPATGSIGVVTIKNCVAFGNGKLTDGSGSANGDMNGFKLGGSNGACPTPHVITNSLAFNNGACGFTDNGNGGAIKMSNCTSVSNGLYAAKGNFMCYRTSSSATYNNLVSYNNSSSDKYLGKLSKVISSNGGKYYYTASASYSSSTSPKTTAVTISNSDFTNTTIPGYSSGKYATNYHEVFRNSDGSINMNGLFEIKSSSSLASYGVGASLSSGTSGSTNPGSGSTETGSTESGSTESGSTESGSTESGSTGSTTAQEYVQNFTENGTSSSFYTISGNTSTSKGSVSYNGKTLKTCLKMESSTSIKFEAPKAGKLTLVFGGSTSASGKAVKIDGKSYDIDSTQIITVDLAAGSHTVAKGDSIFLFYMVYSVEGEAAHEHSYTVTVTTAATCGTAGVKTYTCSCGASYTETIAATGHSYSSEWTVDVEATTTTEGSKSRHCTKCDAKTDVTVIPKLEAVKNGLVSENGAIYYYVNGAVATDYTGTLTNSDGTWYIINGKVDSNYTGVRKSGSDFWYVVNGKVNTTFVGLYSYADYWWYITDGKIQTSYTDIVDYAGYKWFVSGGKVDTSYTGLKADSTGTFYCVQAGKINLSYTGLIQSGGAWWYIENGVLDTSVTGIVTSGGSQWFVATGKLQSSYTGTLVYNGVTHTIVNGKVTATN